VESGGSGERAKRGYKLKLFKEQFHKNGQDRDHILPLNDFWEKQNKIVDKIADILIEYLLGK